jgi:hypothetical protein
MRKFLVAGLAFAIVPASLAFANSDMKVTGGGQVIADGSGGGPGDTIAFNAQQIGPFAGTPSVAPAKGQLQVNQRTPGAGGKPTVKFHGNVTCIRDFVDDNGTSDTSDDEAYIRFGGYQKLKGKQTAIPFTVDAQDNGEGMAALESDMIFFRQRNEGDQPCDDSDTATSLRTSTLTRGNVQQH